MKPVSVGQEFGSSSLGGSSYGSLLRLQSEHQSGLQSSEGLTGVGWSTQGRSFTWRPRLFARCLQEASIPLHMDLSTRLLECPHNMAAGFTQTGQFKREKGAGCSALILEAIHFHVLHILFFFRSQSLSIVHIQGEKKLGSVLKKITK